MEKCKWRNANGEMQMRQIEKLTRNCEEIVTRKELKELMKKKEKRAYIGYEPSGLAHLGFVLGANKIKDLISAGFDVSILLADWHAQINDKFNGNMEDIRVCGEYLKDVFRALGVKNANFLYASDLVSDPEYWATLIRIGKKTTLARAKRALTIMGRKASETMDYSKTMYPLMQATDIFRLEVDVALAGVDQRRAHMLARDAAEALGWKKPVAMHFPLIPSLSGSGRMDDIKMSKSKPGGAIFLHDDEEKIRTKIKNGYCPAGIVENNPITMIWKTMIFQCFEKVKIERSEKYGGDIEIGNYKTFEDLFREKKLHPLDVKNATVLYLSQILKPVRQYLEKNDESLRRVEALTKDR